MKSPGNTEFRSADGRFGLVIGNRQLERLHALCAASHPLETGGVLTGYYNAGHDTAVVTRAAGPPPDSQRERTRFYRGTQGLNGMLGRLWQKREYYLGEWHYHPGGAAQPSATDVKQMQEIARDTPSHCPEPILLLIGANGTTGAHIFFAAKPYITLLPKGQTHCQREDQ